MERIQTTYQQKLQNIYLIQAIKEKKKHIDTFKKVIPKRSGQPSVRIFPLKIL